MERMHHRHRSEHYPVAAHKGHHPYFDLRHPQAFIQDTRGYDRPGASYEVPGLSRGHERALSYQQGDRRSHPTPPPPSFQQSNSLSPRLYYTSNVASADMSSIYDPSRRRSIGGDGVSSHFSPTERTPAQLPFARGVMPPPSPPTTALPNHGSAPFGPPTASPFSGIRDLANLSSTRRTGGGMSISSILGGGDDTKTMQPPSPGRARASSMREPYRNGGFRERSPVTPRSATTAMDQRRAETERAFIDHSRMNGFRAFYPPGQNGASIEQRLPGRPSSQPSEHHPPALLSEMSHKSDETHMARFPPFRPPTNGADAFRTENNWAAADRSAFSSPGNNKDYRDVFSPAYAAKSFGSPLRDDAPRPDLMNEIIESKALNGRFTPPTYAGFRNGYPDRPLTYEEHQRLEAAGIRQELQRKDSDPRSLFNISPELRRRGRDSPLPQAVQGAQPRHIGPGGDHPGIKSEFGRMFSGLGSGAGSATPVAGQSMNNGTPSRILSPARPGDDMQALLEEQERSASARPGRKTGMRRPREDEPEKYDGRMTPSLSQKGSKRSKTAHPLIHHHHHHHHHTTHHHHHHDLPQEQQAGTYGMIRFPSNPPTQPIHRHHHHHHTHPGHHHHVVQSIRKPSITVRNEQVLESVSSKPRAHLGSMPYRAKAKMPSGKSTSDHYMLFSTESELIPRFDGRENCTYTVRVPRWYLTRPDAQTAAGDQSWLEAVCRTRQIWGTDIYTDDTDVLAAAVHSGWLKGDFGYSNQDLDALDQSDVNGMSIETTLTERPTKPVSIPLGRDIHITILILPLLTAYAGSHRHHILSRDWKEAELHDGLSYMIHKIQFVDEGASDRGAKRSAANRKARITLHDAKRREAAAALLSLPVKEPSTAGSNEPPADADRGSLQQT